MAAKRRTKSAVAVLGVCIALPGVPVISIMTRPAAGPVEGGSELSRILDRAEKVCSAAAPELRTARFEATPLVAYQDGKRRRLWSVEVSNMRGEYVGDTVWDAERGDLVSTTWRVEEGKAAAPSLTKNEAAEIAITQLSQIDVSVPTEGWRVAHKPQRVGGTWTVWCQSPGARFRVKLDDASGRLLSAERRT